MTFPVIVGLLLTDIVGVPANNEEQKQ